MVGPSGSGKSTLALAIAGLVPREVPGELTGSLAVTGEVGIVFQDPARQLVMERAEDDVAFGLESRAWPVAEMRSRVPAALAEVGLAGFERRRPNRLSGGEQQRLAVAGVLAPRPGILVLDEPTANLDPEGTASIFDRLAGIRARRAATIVLVEHRVDAAWPLADRVLALGADGRPIDVGSPADVLERSGERLRAAGIWLPGVSRRPPSAATGPPIRPNSTTPIVTASGVSFAFERGRPVLSGVDLQIAAGERVALVGANGSGKSTLGRLLAGLLRPAAGLVRLAGEDPARLPSRRLAERAGFVFQDPELSFVENRVDSEIGAGLDERTAGRAREVAECLGLPLEALGGMSPYRLSGGEARRLSLVPALARRPDLLVLDEPTFGQDRRGYEALVEIIREHVIEDTALLAATHDERFVADVASRVVRLERGRVVSDRRVG